MSENGNVQGKRIEVRDSGDVKEFVGVELSRVSTQTKFTTRWTEMALYKMTDGTDRYVIHVVGYSVIFHKYKGLCNSGVHAYSDELPKGVQPCRDCAPVMRDGVPVDEEVALEEERYTVYVCETPDQVIARMRFPRMGGKQPGVISGPGQRLLNEAALLDDGIYSKITTVVRL